jgi:hypothetical protein
MKIKLINSAILIHLFLFIGVFFSCKSTKKIVTKNDKIIVSNSNQSISNISSKTKQFLNEFEKELKESNKNIKTFTPTKRLIDEYSIKKIDNEYFISGFIKTNENFDKKVFENSEVKFGQSSGQIITVNVPLYFLTDFLKMAGIEYFEMSEKVQTK